MMDAAPPSDALCLELVRVQRQLEAVYELEPTPDIAPFVRVDPADAREHLLVREQADAVDIIVLLPRASAEAFLSKDARLELDAYLGALEGISHFIHLADRARTELPTTLLELELQAEVDKFVILSGSPENQNTGDLVSLHRRLYEQVRFLHPSESEHGERYRLANDLAARLWSQLIRKGPAASHRDTLKRFYRASQAEKISMVRAA
ncbi:MAG TPA: hypothetical protein VMG12_25495 [Polyangiaceae bacterium]|nr:hypothetical protein [Polyangiaceae bacterium]